MRHAWGLLVVAACYQPHDNEVPFPDATIRHDAPFIYPDAPPHFDAGTPVPDAYVPDARPDAPLPAVCGDGVRAPGEICFGSALTINAGELVWSARLLDVDGDGKRDLIYLTRTN